MVTPAKRGLSGREGGWPCVRTVGRARTLASRAGARAVPMEDAPANVSLDLSGRAAVAYNVRFSGDKIGTFDTQLVEEFLRRLATKAGMNLHVNVPYGSNDHHVAEAG